MTNLASVNVSSEYIDFPSIIHCDLSKASSEPIYAMEAACFVILWWHDCPIGQIGNTGVTGRVLDRTKLMAAVPPDVLRHAKRIIEYEAVKKRPVSIETSVVICTRDRPDALARCLASFSQQTLFPT